MGRWTQYDEDDYRLPEGMKRVGYDSDTQKYYFRDRDGQLYEGVEGSEFGPLTPAKESDLRGMFQAGDDNENDLEAAPKPTRSDGYQPLTTDSSIPADHSRVSSAYRTLFPFFLIVVASLLLLWRLLPSSSPRPPPCPKGSIPYSVKGGDTCWAVAQTYGCSVDTLKELNPKLDCDKLMRGDRMCLPAPKSA